MNEDFSLAIQERASYPIPREVANVSIKIPSTRRGVYNRITVLRYDMNL